MKGNYNNSILEGDALDKLKEIEDESIDLIVTDPPYGYSFMGKEWDKAVVGVPVWKECLRVLKAGAFAFVMSAPRQDVLSRMIVNLQDAGFRTDFTSIYWTYASGFPKAANVSKLADKRNGKGYDKPFRDYLNEQRIKKGLTFKTINQYLGYSDKGGNFASDLLGDKLNNRYLFPSLQNYSKLKTLLELDNRFDELVEREEAEREIIETKRKARAEGQHSALPTLGAKTKYIDINYTKSATEQAKRLDGSYAGFQPKPAVEVVLTVMKPLSQSTFVDQALANGKGITWVDDCRIPFQNEKDSNATKTGFNDKGFREYGQKYGYDKIVNPSKFERYNHEKGRFPANLLVSDDALNDGKIRKGSPVGFKGKNLPNEKGWNNNNMNVEYVKQQEYTDSGSYSRYFSLDKWHEAQFIITPKASLSERNKGLENSDFQKTIGHNRFDKCSNCGGYLLQNPTRPSKCNCDNPIRQDNTIKGNHHPTVKPIKLMSYLITMGSRENDIVLDLFCGSGTTLIAAQQLNRKWIGIELNKEYVEIARKRIEPYLIQQKLL